MATSEIGETHDRGMMNALVLICQGEKRVDNPPHSTDMGRADTLVIELA